MKDTSQLISIITSVISNFGFPIAITAYLLLRFEKRIEILNNKISELIEAIKIGVTRK
ncbi:YvrJ family protein [Paenibacillus residui]|uniref:YvrJ family protein n=1 Tax=Paenibacillus residui TaxID=629724 RepID=A0ABW3DEN0_9BACL